MHVVVVMDPVFKRIFLDLDEADSRIVSSTQEGTNGFALRWLFSTTRCFDWQITPMRIGSYD